MKKIFLVLFSLIMMFSVSFGIEANVEYSSTKTSGGTTTDKLIGSYASGSINSILENYSSDTSNENYKNELDLLIKTVEEEGHKYVIYYNDTNDKYYLIIDNLGLEGVEFIYLESIKKIAFLKPPSGGSLCAYSYNPDKSKALSYSFSSSSQIYYCVGTSFPTVTTIHSSNTDIYSLTNGTSTGTFCWDGISYYYKAPSQGDSNGTNLTDEEIAEIVERFINSNAYLEKAYYNGDYFITYDNLTGYFRGYSYAWNIDLAIEYGNYNEEGEFITTGTKEGEAWRIRPYEFSGDIFNKFGDWLASKFNTYAFEYFSISPDSSIKPRYVGSLEHNYCSNYKENEVVIYSSKQIRYVGEETNSEGKTETVVTDNYIPPTVLKDSETGEQIVIRDNLQESSDSLEAVITPNADFSGLKQAFEKYISFVNISSITWLTTAISSMITIFIPFVALGIIIFLINRILNGGS